MTLFDTLTQPQQDLLLGEKADRGTRKAVFARGLITECDLSGVRTATLTDLGRMVLFEHAQRHNRITKFPLGSEVVWLDFAIQNDSIVFYGLAWRVISLTTAMVNIERSHRRTRVNPRSLALLSDIEAEGLIGMVQR